MNYSALSLVNYSEIVCVCLTGLPLEAPEVMKTEMSIHKSERANAKRLACVCRDAATTNKRLELEFEQGPHLPSKLAQRRTRSKQLLSSNTRNAAGHRKRGLGCLINRLSDLVRTR